MVWSRGGGFVDMSADGLYLTNHYSQQPYIGDGFSVKGSARSHSVCIIPVDGPVICIVDVPYWRDDLVVADDVRQSIEVTETAVDAIRGLGLEGSSLALVGANNMSAAAYIGFRGGLPDATFSRFDRMVEQLRVRKSANELEVIRRAAQLGNRTVETLVDAVVAGATEADAVGMASATLIAGGGVLYDAACVSGTRSNQYAYARLPSADPIRRFEVGDLFHVDCYGAYGGYLFDFSRSRVVGDDPTDAQRALLESPIAVVEFVCAAIRPGMTGDEIYRLGDDFMFEDQFFRSMRATNQSGENGDAGDVSRSGQSSPSSEMPGIGHGLGLGWEMPHLVPDDEHIVAPGTYLAVEVFVRQPTVGGVQFEHNGLVTESGFEILTNARSRWW